ncbi:thermonuclease family protein [Mesorhizobium sp. YIM 152430]|uniref:thermonuclease family protein n=1 Tax=Mesorhizobium sp. YIM 152430 TaxID=3031761 RepID=UPI0023DBA2B9|nr:thermonuclease family protein [Mesorhizobium sp. YIM 152430]MDF1599114.1 thermonuclease family protein [Mesorhizobium sp. YIM 152430]
MRPVALFVGVGGLVLVGAVVFGWGQSERASGPPVSEMFGTRPTEEKPPPPPRAERVGRPVAPMIAAPPVDVTQLERVAPREPLSPLGAPEDPATRPPRETLLHRPVVVDAGTIEAQGHRVALEGIEIVAADETCGEGGRSWPCGVHARTAFRNYLRGRAVACTVPGTPGGETIVSRCKLGPADPAAWLVAQGWARAAPGSGYEDDEQAALEAGRGIHGAAPGSN